MKKQALWLVVALLLVGITLYAAEDIAWNQDPTAAGGRRQGILVQQVDNNGVPISAAVSDTVFMDSMVVNASTGAETTKALTGVKQIKLKARTGIDVRVATGTGSSTATTYTVVSAGETLTLTDLNGISMTLAVLGNAATDTGVLSISYTK